MCAFSLLVHTRYSICAIHYVYASQLIRLLYKGLARLKRIALVQNKVRIEAWVVKGIKKKTIVGQSVFNGEAGTAAKRLNLTLEIIPYHVILSFAFLKKKGLLYYLHERQLLCVWLFLIYKKSRVITARVNNK